MVLCYPFGGNTLEKNVESNTEVLQMEFMFTESMYYLCVKKSYSFLSFYLDVY